MSLVRAQVKLVRSITWVDVLLLLGICLCIYALIGVAHQWAGPYRPQTEIDLGPLALLQYSVFSLVRVFAAYVLSLLFTFTYGYWAATSRRAEPVLISLLDILQSVPVLGFMPGLVLALVNLFPNSNLGLELAAVLSVFTCEGWNMVFSFYLSVKTVPPELRDVAHLYRLRKWDIFRQVEVPYAMNGLLWNSMLSMAGGWFYIMIMESFSLGNRDFRLPGIGSYMAVAYDQGNTTAILSGIATMFVLIIAVDRFLWAPLVAWSERFKYDRGDRAAPVDSFVLDWLRRSRMLPSYFRWSHQVRVSLTQKIQARLGQIALRRDVQRQWTRTAWRILRWALIGGGGLILLVGMGSMIRLLALSSVEQFLLHIRDTVLTFFRVTAAVLLGSIWTIPIGVFVGTNPVWTRRLQPVVQIVASFPAPMVFPLLTFVFIQLGISIELGSVLLMLFASQWYILFNVISGATYIPAQFIDVSKIFHVRGWQYWKALILPAIFPSLVNGWITAAGGAWNACIVAEFLSEGSQHLIATGIGATIREATVQGDYARLAGATTVMITTVVLLNRFFWGSLYRLAETRFRVDFQ